MSENTDRLSTALADRYRIESHIGEGGMANVYLAEDLKHERKVAVKVLRPELAAVLGAERFIQEIKTTANLQHPHILPLHDSGDADGFLYYVMPFIDGETLRDKLNRETQLVIDEAVGITTAIADALDYAHRHNVIHRDIKPENILLQDGRPMIADFGIALAVSAAAGGRMTETGLSLGTPHYMSPEQATAEKELTHRSDIYSLGSVLYEMLTGDPPHTGSSAQAIIMKIVTDTARPVTELRKSVPPNVTAAVAKSLEKLAADRFVDAAQFRSALTEESFTHSQAGSPAPLQSRVGSVRQWSPLTIALGAVAGLLAIVLAWSWRQPDPAAPVTRLEMTLSEGRLRDFVLAPDGSFVVFSVGEGPNPQVFIRYLDRLEAEALPGVVGLLLYLSPDKRMLITGFGTEGPRLHSLEGRPGVDLPGRWGRRPWGPDGSIYGSSRLGSDSLVRFAEPTAAPELVAESLGIFIPNDVLPNGRGVLGSRQAGDDFVITVVSPEDGSATDLTEGLSPLYAASGHLLYVRSNDGALMAAPFDQSTLTMSGAAVPVGPLIQTGGVARAAYSIADNGTLLYLTRTATQDRRVVRIGRDGREEHIDPDFTGDFETLALSPDGLRLVVSTANSGGGRGGDTYVKALPDGPSTRVTFDAGSQRPFWSRDGRSILFIRSGRAGVWQVPADGSGPVVPFYTFDRAIAENYVLPDSSLLIRTLPGGGGRDIYLKRPGDSLPQPILPSDFDQSALSLSPDGAWLAYGSAPDGLSQVFVHAFPDGGRRITVTTSGGGSPRWSPDGRELFFVSADDQFMSARVVVGGPMAFETPRALFSAEDYHNQQRSYDIADDGQSFVFIKEAASVNATSVLVLNFFEELKAKVGNE